MSFACIQTTKSFPTLPFEAMKDAVLGKKYTLTLISIGKARAQKLNKAHRGATYVPNVLSFPLDDMTGEIYITPLVAMKECKKFNLTPNGYIGFLFIHGLLHLKGLPHGDTMDKAEKKLMSKFNLQ
jgi:rRNA maturation RNase YbeY